MLTRFGFTSVFDTGSIGENTRRLRDRIESGEVPGPRIRSTGEILAPQGGSPAPRILDALGLMRNQSIEVADGAAALAAAQQLLDAGADGVKLYAATFFPPFATLPESAIRAAVDEAHRRGKPAFAHPTSKAGLLAAVQGGVDVVVHTTPQAGPWDESVLAAMKERGVALDTHAQAMALTSCGTTASLSANGSRKPASISCERGSRRAAWSCSEPMSATWTTTTRATSTP